MCKDVEYQISSIQYFELINNSQGHRESELKISTRTTNEKKTKKKRGKEKRQRRNQQIEMD